MTDDGRASPRAVSSKPVLPGVPAVILEAGPRRQVRVTAYAAGPGRTRVMVQNWGESSPTGPYEGRWIPRQGVGVDLWQVEQLIDALGAVAEAARNVKRGAPCSTP